MAASAQPQLVIAVGDIHGRFKRVEQWIAQLEEARGRTAVMVLSVGDVEAFATAEDHRRKAAKRAMPAEFSHFADGELALRRPMYFIGGNNEDFEALHGSPGGAPIIPNLEYLGRAGVRQLDGLRVAYLSGIYAPKHYETPLVEPRTQQTRKQAGYFRAPEVTALAAEREVDLMLVHEWPRGLLRRRAEGERRPGPALRAYRFPWIGNPITRQLMEQLRPRWLLAGHSHVPFATTVSYDDGSVTRVACLDQAARPDGAVFWLEFSGRDAVRAGWGLSGTPIWKAGEPFTETLTPDTPAEPD